MNKSRLYIFKTAYQAEVAVLLMLFIATGFLCSRAILSIATILFGVNGLRSLPFKSWFKDRYWLFGLLWIAWFALTWFWSEDKADWLSHVQVKLPILLLPLAFAGLPAISRKQWLWVVAIQSGALLMGCAWSLSFLFSNPAAYIEGYKVSHLLPTPADRDHITFSMAVALCIVALQQSWIWYVARWQKGLALVAMIFLAAYLHILAAKTGLLAFYIFIVLLLVYQLWQRRFLTFILSMAVLVLGSWAAFSYVPTLKHRADYVKYTFVRWKEGHRDLNLSDAGRAISYQMALQIIENHPVAGVGAGDMRTAMQQEYLIHHPEVEKVQVLLPHNQMLIIALGAGVGCALLFCFWLFIPVLQVKQSRNGYYLFVIWFLLMIPLLTDPFLEMQFGLSVYLMSLLWHRNLMNKPF